MLALRLPVPRWSWIRNVAGAVPAGTMALVVAGLGAARAEAQAVQLAVTASAVQVAGTPFTVTVTAEDVSNATVASYPGTVQLTSTDGAAMLPANATLTNGVGTFQVTLNTVGNATVTATDTVTPAITGTSANLAATPAGPALVFITDFTKTNNVFTDLNQQFPNTGPGTPGSGVGVPNAAFYFDPATYTSGNAVANSDLAPSGITFLLTSDPNGRDYSEIPLTTPLVVPLNVTGPWSTC
jgi:hypothetical protein